MVDRRDFLKISAAGMTSLALPVASFGDGAVEEVETKLFSDSDAVFPKWWDVRLFSDSKLGVFGLRADKKYRYEWRISLSDARSAFKRPGTLVTGRRTIIPVLTRTDTTIRESLMKIGVLPETSFSTPGYGERFALIDVPPPDSIRIPGHERIHRKWLPLEAVQRVVARLDR